MLKKKSVNIFDTEKIKEGYFVTYSKMCKEWQEDEEGEAVAVYEESQPYNGLVTSVHEEKITLIDFNGKHTTINIEDLSPDKSIGKPKFKILGIKESAIS